MTHQSRPASARYASDDASATLSVFTFAVTTTAAADYSPRQIAAWARTEERLLPEWDSARSAVDTFVAEVDGEPVGFAEVDADGLVNTMFVRPDRGRRGVTGALLEALRQRATEAGTPRLTPSSTYHRDRSSKLTGSASRPACGSWSAVPLLNFRMVTPLRSSRK